MCSCGVGVVHQEDPTVLHQLALTPVGVTGRNVALDPCRPSARGVDHGVPDQREHAQNARERVMLRLDLQRRDHHDHVVPVGSYAVAMAFE
jgi:hypothetical protein